MTPNIGTIDRIVRFVAGLALLSVAIFWSGAQYGWIGWFGVVPIVAALLRWTPAYALFGISTIRVKRK